jgi:hypothetical protein
MSAFIDHPKRFGQFLYANPGIRQYNQHIAAVALVKLGATRAMAAKQ